MGLTKIGTDGVKDDAITSGKIPANAVGTSEIADDAIRTRHYGDNSIDTAFIADQAVTLAKLEHGTSSNDGKFLRANNGADPTFETVNTDLVSDTSPQLGGDLDSNGHHIVITDGEELRLGDDHDTKIKFNGSKSQIVSSVQFDIDADIIDIHNAAANKTKARFLNNQVELYHNNSKKIETTSNGIKTSGRAEIDGNCFPYSDNNNDLGLAGNRWQDLYLSGNIYLGGTGSANALDDYEEGTFTPSIYYQNSNGITIGTNSASGKYTKIGRVVWIVGYINWSVSGSPVNDNVAIQGLPFDTSTGQIAAGGTRFIGNISLNNTSNESTTHQIEPYGANGVNIITDDERGNKANELGGNSNMYAKYQFWYHTA